MHSNKVLKYIESDIFVLALCMELILNKQEITKDCYLYQPI